MDTIENSCNFCGIEDPNVSKVQNGFTQDPPVLDIAAKHFWFTIDELISFHICDTCRKQLLEFHQFYCQVEVFHTAIREKADIKVECAPFESNTNHLEHESVNFKQGTESANEKRIGVETVDDIAIDIATNLIKLEPIDIETEAGISNEESIETATNCDKLEIALQSDAKHRPVTDDEIRIFCRLQCHICSEEFNDFNNLQAHGLKVHNQPCYVKCCDCRFKNIGRLQEHILVHMDPTRFQCNQCKKNLKTMRSLTRHKHSVHCSEDAMIYKCTMCPKKYAKLYLLNRHMTCHLDPRPSEYRLECPICLKVMKNESWLEVHLTHIHGSME